MRQGRLFHQNKEQVSIYYEDTLAEYDNDPNTDPIVYTAEDIDAVFHPIVGNLVYNSGVLSQNQADADWRVILAEPNAAIKKTDKLLRYRGETNETKFTIVDVLTFAGAMHLLISEEGLE